MLYEGVLAVRRGDGGGPGVRHADRAAPRLAGQHRASGVLVHRAGHLLRRSVVIARPNAGDENLAHPRCKPPTGERRAARGRLRATSPVGLWFLPALASAHAAGIRSVAFMACMVAAGMVAYALLASHAHRSAVDARRAVRHLARRHPAGAVATGTIAGMTHPHKARRGLQRIVHAAGYSIAGLSAAWRHESAFRQECALAVVMLPAAWWVGRNWIEMTLLAGSVMGVLIVELLNSAIEAVVDRVSAELASVVQARQGHRQRRGDAVADHLRGAVVRGAVAALDVGMRSPPFRRLRLLRVAARVQPGVHAQRASRWALPSGGAAGSWSTAVDASA